MLLRVTPKKKKNQRFLGVFEAALLQLVGRVCSMNFFLVRFHDVGQTYLILIILNMYYYF